jgi:hypothetical protein
VIAALTGELDYAYRAVVARLPDNQAVRFDCVNGKNELILSSLDELEEPPSLIALREAVAARIPRVDLPEILLGVFCIWGLGRNGTENTLRQSPSLKEARKPPPYKGRGYKG